MAEFQPTRPLRGATEKQKKEMYLSSISTHAPLAGRDEGRGLCPRGRRDFNPRAPCGARQEGFCTKTKPISISTHAPLAGRDLMVGVVFSSMIFQPTRPLRGATLMVGVVFSSMIFQPTRPLRGATIAGLVHRLRAFDISTHAPLAGRDSKSVQITMHIFAITDKFQMLLHRMPPVRAFCSFLMQENHADFGCEPPK